MIEQSLPAISAVTPDSDELNQAMDDARGSLQQFLDAYANPSPTRRGFHFKVRFEMNGDVEYAWVNDLLDLFSESRLPTGILANEGRLPGLRFGRRVSFQRSAVVDWMYMEDGQMVGGFTNKVLLRARRKASSTGRLEFLTRKWHASLTNPV